MLRIKLLYVENSPAELINSADSRIEKLIDNDKFIIVDNEPDVLFFMSGGTETEALEHIKNSGLNILIGSKHDNSYASASEVKAYLNERKIKNILLDEEESQTKLTLKKVFDVKNALNNLRGKQLGLIGKVSNWLISSSIKSEVLKDRLGINLKIVPWEDLSHFSEFEPNEALIKTFEKNSKFDLTKTSQVYDLLNNTIKKHNFDAITVECFPMVKKDKVTACLPLAKFNNDSIPAGCEGDLTAITGMMLCKEITGIIPWTANVNKISDDVCMFSHCTIAPDLVNDFTIKTHFETGVGTAIQGDFKADFITIFRFNNKLDKAFITTAEVINRPKSNSACRSQIEVKINPKDVKLLQEKPLGNHHLIFPGDCYHELVLACKLSDIEIVE